MTRVTLLIGLFFISCVLLFWNPFWSITETKENLNENLYLPDFTTKNMTLKRFDEDGYLSSLVKADKMEYYNNNVTTFTKPSYIIEF